MASNSFFGAMFLLAHPFSSSVQFDVLALAPTELKALVQRLRPSGIHLLAEKVETDGAVPALPLAVVRAIPGLSCSPEPTVLTRRSLDSTRLACLRLLAVLAGDDFDLADAEAAIRSDPGLTLAHPADRQLGGSGLRRRASPRSARRCSCSVRAP